MLFLGTCNSFKTKVKSCKNSSNDFILRSTCRISPLLKSIPLFLFKDYVPQTGLKVSGESGRWSRRRRKGDKEISGLGCMTFPKARLDTRKKIVSLKIRRNLEGDDLLADFRDERDVGDGRKLTGPIESSASRLRSGKKI